MKRAKITVKDEHDNELALMVETNEERERANIILRITPRTGVAQSFEIRHELVVALVEKSPEEDFEFEVAGYKAKSTGLGDL